MNDFQNDLNKELIDKIVNLYNSWVIVLMVFSEFDDSVNKAKMESLLLCTKQLDRVLKEFGR